MALTEQPNVVRLSPDHISRAMELSREAGWNQLPADWLFFMNHGNVFGLIRDGELAATAAIMPYGDHIAWIGMVLTRKSWRGHGFGTLLLKTCIKAIESRHRTAVLDATPAGEPIYRDLGFEPVERFTRWQGEGRGCLCARADDDPAAITAVNAAFGADRTPLLHDLAARCPAARLSLRNGAAYGFGRDGRLASQIGPVVGTNESAAGELMETMIASLGGPVFLDASDEYASFPARLTALGFSTQRSFLRMKKGDASTPGRMAVIAGPEFG